MKRPYPRFAQDFSGETVTQQQFTAASDINNIVASYERTGIDPYASRLENQQFGDGEYRTYQEALNNVADLNSRFHELPMAIREQYNNDPETYLSALEAQNVVKPDPTDPPPQEAPDTPPEPPPQEVE